MRAIPGVERVTGGTYTRSIGTDSATGILTARALPRAPAIRVRLALSSAQALLPAATRAARLFDLDADPATIAAHLRADPALARILPRAGVRVPGTWDPFEAGIRALLGQQISVAAARTIAGRLVRAHGVPLVAAHEHAARAAEWAGGRPAMADDAVPRASFAATRSARAMTSAGRSGRNDDAVTHLFPTPDAVAAADLTQFGLPRARAAAVRAFAEAVASGRLDFGAMTGLEDAIAKLTMLPGIGEWTAHYIAMRGLGEPDAFPASDLGVRQALARGGRLPDRAVALARADRWRPWRAYAVIALWSASGDSRDAETMTAGQGTRRTS